MGFSDSEAGSVCFVGTVSCNIVPNAGRFVSKPGWARSESEGLGFPIRRVLHKFPNLKISVSESGGLLDESGYRNQGAARKRSAACFDVREHRREVVQSSTRRNGISLF